MLVPEIFAADAASNVSGFGMSFVSFVPLILIVLVFYFFVVRPHHKRLKELRKMIDQIKRGDTIATSGGIIGTVSKVDEANAQFIVEIAPKVEMKLLKSAVSEVLNKGAQVKLDEKDKIEKDNKKNKSKRGQDNKNKSA